MAIMRSNFGRFVVDSGLMLGAGVVGGNFAHSVNRVESPQAEIGLRNAEKVRIDDLNSASTPHCRNFSVVSGQDELAKFLAGLTNGAMLNVRELLAGRQGTERRLFVQHLSAPDELQIENISQAHLIAFCNSKLAGGIMRSKLVLPEASISNWLNASSSLANISISASPQEGFAKSIELARMDLLNSISFANEEIPPAVDRVLQAKRKLSRMIGDISTNVRERRWSSVFADDVSGRIPGIVIWEQMRKWAHEQQLKPPGLYFLASGRGGVGVVGDPFASITYEPENLKNLTNRITAIRTRENLERVLLVTDYLESGKSINRLATALLAQNVPFDVLSVGTALTEDQYKILYPAMQNSKFFTGGRSHEMWTGSAGARTAFRQAIGVEKYGSEATSRPNRVDRAAISTLRKQLSLLSQEFYDTHFKKH
jgi:hypothetical protein